MSHPDRAGHASLELAKWVAVVTMVVDHYGKIVAPELYMPTHAIGRVAFPLFAAIIGLRLALSPELAGRYLRRLLPWAVVSQPAFVVAGRGWTQGNILFTLALGVAAVLTARALRGGRWLPGLGGAAVCLGLSGLVEFGPAGVAAVPALALLAARTPRAAIWMIGPVGLVANLRLVAPYLTLADTTALIASGVALLSVALPLRLPRLPTHAFYALYPAHLLALHWLDLAS
jgi:hypothetical protein